MVYVPILRGRDGEFQALKHISLSEIRSMRPIIEVPSSGKGTAADVDQFVHRARRHLPFGLHIGVDSAQVISGSDDGIDAVREIAEALAGSGIAMAPIVRPDDDPALLARLGQAARLHDGSCVVRWNAASGVPTEADLDRLRSGTGVAIDHCELVVDCQEVRSMTDVEWAGSRIRRIVSWARSYPWRSMTLASGAMRQSLTGLPKRVPTPIDRCDQMLWQRVGDLGLRYGDYGITHPKPPAAQVPGRPMPTLRYTADEAWWIYRWPRESKGNASFLDLCDHLVISDHWPTEGGAFSWGDQQLALRAAREGEPGGPSQWIAWGTSHHLAFVMRRLAERV
ncbi:beta family protein [Actinoplanes xinjiangensis]|uniref:beta family protein n=1 Tax=Actinoplanes xinjiangensis TaxID=512350 RepID=UPI003428FAD5